MKNNLKKKILSIIGLILVYVLISLSVYGLLRCFGLTSVDKIRAFVSKTGAWSYLVYFVFQVAVSTFICILPFEDELLTASAIILFGVNKGFLVSAFNMFVTSSLQFVMGRCFCKKVVAKIVGEDSISKYENYLSVKGEIMLPILYAIPLFPHDTLCVLAGMSKMKYWYFAPITFIMRSIEIVCVCFLGSGIIDFSMFGVIDWVIVANLLIIDVYLILKLQKFVENNINSR